MKLEITTQALLLKLSGQDIEICKDMEGGTERLLVSFPFPDGFYTLKTENLGRYISIIAEEIK